MPPKNVRLILGHPSGDSLCAAIAWPSVASVRGQPGGREDRAGSKTGVPRSERFSPGSTVAGKVPLETLRLAEHEAPRIPWHCA